MDVLWIGINECPRKNASAFFNRFKSLEDGATQAQKMLAMTTQQKHAEEHQEEASTRKKKIRRGRRKGEKQTENQKQNKKEKKA